MKILFARWKGYDDVTNVSIFRPHLKTRRRLQRSKSKLRNSGTRCIHNRSTCCGLTFLRCYSDLSTKEDTNTELSTEKCFTSEASEDPGVDRKARRKLAQSTISVKLDDVLDIDTLEFSQKFAVNAFNEHGFPSLLLAQRWDGADPKGYWMSEKLDGVRCFWTGSVFLSRTGNRYYAPEFFTKDLPKYLQLDGELWCGRQLFQSTVSIVRTANSHNPEWSKVSYKVFDLPSLGMLPFEERMEILTKFFAKRNLKHVEVIQQELCEGDEHLKKRLDEIEALKGEGLMLREPKSVYEPTRSFTLLKVKNFFDSEAKIVEYEQGKGKQESKVGAFVCELPNGKKMKVGTGLKDEERERPPPIGTIITYRYQELTASGIPRFPTFVGVRPDAQWPPLDVGGPGTKATNPSRRSREKGKAKNAEVAKQGDSTQSETNVGDAHKDNHTKPQYPKYEPKVQNEKVARPRGRRKPLKST